MHQHTVISLNYDLTLYWAMLLFNAANGSWFKDAFHHGEFQTNWGYLRRPLPPAAGATLVFYPHGSLSVARDYIGDETKIAASTGEMGDLLDTITHKWSSGHYIPVFVSEGTSREKVAAIRRINYLTNVYEEVLPALGESLIVYGWSFDERDQHVIDAISVSPPKQINGSIRVHRAIRRGSTGFLLPGTQSCWPFLARHRGRVLRFTEPGVLEQSIMTS